MDVKEITSAEDLETAKRKGISLVDFGAPWCAPCRLQEPIIRRLADRFQGEALISHMNVDQRADVASELGIRSIPTLILFKNGREVQRFVGLQSEVTLAEALQRVRRL